MREIKFRVWDNVDYMSSPFDLQDVQEKKVQWTRDCVVMQYTGLKDRNGKEIYEGDIVSFTLTHDSTTCIEAKSKVEWYRHAWRLNRLWLFTEASSIEIIGNIYES